MIETEIWKQDPGNKWLLHYAGQRKTDEVFRELKTFLEKEGLLPDEYFDIAYGFDQESPLFPKTDDFRCYAQWGGSEGIYLEVELLTQNPATGKQEWINFATGKTLSESIEAFNKMQYTAGRIYCVLTRDPYEPEQKLEANEEPTVPSGDMEPDKLETAKQIINDYCMEEFEHGADFSDLSHVDLAYSRTSDDEHTVQVYADLEASQIVYQVDGSDVRVVGGTQADLIEHLENLSFDALIADAEAAGADRIAEKAIDWGEAMYGADGHLAFHGPDDPSPEPPTPRHGPHL